MGVSNDDSQSDGSSVEGHDASEPTTPPFVDWGSSNLLTHGKPSDSIKFKHERNE